MNWNSPARCNRVCSIRISTFLIFEIQVVQISSWPKSLWDVSTEVIYRQMNGNTKEVACTWRKWSGSLGVVSSPIGVKSSFFCRWKMTDRVPAMIAFPATFENNRPTVTNGCCFIRSAVKASGGLSRWRWRAFGLLVSCAWNDRPAARWDECNDCHLIGSQKTCLFLVPKWPTLAVDGQFRLQVES